MVFWMLSKVQSSSLKLPILKRTMIWTFTYRLWLPVRTWGATTIRSRGRTFTRAKLSRGRLSLLSRPQQRQVGMRRELIVSSLTVNHFRLSFSVRVSDSGTVQTGATERYGCVHESPDRTGSQPLHFIHPRETRILRNQDRNNSSQWDRLCSPRQEFHFEL